MDAAPTAVWRRPAQPGRGGRFRCVRWNRLQALRHQTPDTLPSRGAQKRAELLRNPCILRVPKSKGDKTAIGYLTPVLARTTDRKKGGNAMQPLHSWESPMPSARRKLELAASPLRSRGSPINRGQNQNWLPPKLCVWHLGTRSLSSSANSRCPNVHFYTHAGTHHYKSLRELAPVTMSHRHDVSDAVPHGVVISTLATTLAIARRFWATGIRLLVASQLNTFVSCVTRTNATVLHTK